VAAFITDPQANRDKIIEDMVRELLIHIGEDPNREGLVDTPKRVTKMMHELLAGYNQEPEEVLSATFKSDCNEMVVVREIAFASICEHHALPFTGTVDIGYIPNGIVVGISKLVRLVEVFARRLQIQENMTSQIADNFYRIIKPHGVMVKVTARHMCMSMRGVKNAHSEMVTSAVRGSFEQPEVKSEFLKLCEKK